MVACSGVGSPAAPRPLATAVVTPPSTVVWTDVPGIYAKIEQTQFTDNKATHFPPAYNVNASTLGHTSSVYYELQKYKWFRGIQIPLNWKDIETSEGSFSFTYLNQIFDMVESISAKTGITKRIILAPVGKAFSVEDGPKILPADMTTAGHMGAAYSNSTSGPLYIIDKVQNTVSPHHVFIDMPRYDYLFGYDSDYNQPNVSSYGYHFNWMHFRDGLTGNSPRNAEDIYILYTRFKAFLTAVHNEFKNRSALAGYIMLEPPPLKAVTTSENNDYNLMFDGRLAFLKWFRGLVTNHMVVEAPNHNNTWMTQMTGANAADGCIVNRLGFTGPNMHTGQNLQGLYNARKNLAGQIPMIVQCQPQDMKSMSGNVTKANTATSPAPNDYWRWDKFAPDYGGATVASGNVAIGDPNTYLEAALDPDTGLAISNDDPITDGEWVIIRTLYLKGNMLSYQRNTANDNPFGWNDLIDYIENKSILTSANTGGSIKDDPAGGLITTQPTWVVK